MFEIALPKDSKTIVVRGIELIGPGGSARVNLLLDTGSAYSLISWNLAGILGYDPAQAKPIPIVTGNGVVHAPLIHIGSVVAHDIRVNNMSTICHDISGLADAEGLLGLSFLRQVRTLLDYRALYLRID